MQISTSFEDLCDQNVIVYLLRVKAKEYMPQVLRHMRPSFRCRVEQEVLQSDHAPAGILGCSVGLTQTCGECRYCWRMADTA